MTSYLLAILAALLEQAQQQRWQMSNSSLSVVHWQSVCAQAGCPDHQSADVKRHGTPPGSPGTA